MKKIAFLLATSGHSGVDRIMTNLIIELARQGYSIDLLHIENHGPYLESIPLNVRWIPLGTKHVDTSLFAVMKYLKQEQPVVLFSDKDRVNRLAIFSRFFSGVKTKVIIRNGTTISIDLKNRKLFDRLQQSFSMRYLYNFSDAIVMPSKGAKADFVAFSGQKADKIHVLPNAVISADFYPKAQEHIEHAWFKKGELPVILGIGELNKRKDFATLIKAFAKVRESKNCRLMILGEGKQRKLLEALIQELGLEQEVLLPGFIKNPYPYIKKATVFVHTSHWEGMGIVIVEALALGINVVSVDCPHGPRELLVDGKYGKLVGIGDIEALADNIIETLDKPLDAEFLQQAAKPYLSENSAKAYLALFGV